MGRKRRVLVESTVAATGFRGEGARATHKYVVVFEPEASRVIDLPDQGEVLLGRGPEAGLRLHDAKISRRHALLHLCGNRMQIEDLGSQNGTLVNGQRIAGVQALVSGDAIELGPFALVFHARAIEDRALAPDSLESFRTAIQMEIERVAKSDLPLSIVSLIEDAGETEDGEDGATVASESAIARSATEWAGRLDRRDRYAQDGTGRLLLLLPETDHEQASHLIRDIEGVIADRGLRFRAGVATYPADGYEVDTLVTSARQAADQATVGHIAGAAQTFRTFWLGDQEILVADPTMLRLFALVERLAVVDLPVLVQGETGAGKELVAQALHQFSPRGKKRLLSLNCAALQEHLVESELFGHEKGAFTGATASKPGLLEAAEGGTVLLDEIGEMPLPAQAKLLRALDTKRIMRVGDVRERQIDVRLVAATNRDLASEVGAGRFREDLYFRLSGAALWVPPLRDRPRELAFLAKRFLDRGCEQARRESMPIAPDAQRRLARHPWPGNVRELRNVMEFMAATSTEPLLTAGALETRLGTMSAPQHETPSPPGVATNGSVGGEARSLAPALPALAPPGPTQPGFRPIDEEIRELEKCRIQEALEAAAGNQRHAAQLIGMPLRTFVGKLAQFGLRQRERGKP